MRRLGSPVKHMLILGGGMVGRYAGDMIGEIALAIEIGTDAVDIGMVAEIAHGSCTDVPAARK